MKLSNSVNLTKCSCIELNELLERQIKILSNRKFVNSLPDKGKRIKLFKEKIESELKKRDTVDEASHLLSQLTIKSLPNEIEWSGKDALKVSNQAAVADESDDETNPLKMVATHSGTQISYRKTVESASPSSLVTDKDIEEAKSFSIPHYAQKVCSKFGEKTAKERFIPNQPRQKELSKTGFKASSENVKQRLGTHWEVTAATPPVPIHGHTEEISLAMSLELQKTQAEKLKQIQIQEAVSRLKNSTTVKSNTSFLPISNIMQYRTPVDPTSIFEGTPHKEPTQSQIDGSDFDEDIS